MFGHSTRARRYGGRESSGITRDTKIQYSTVQYSTVQYSTVQYSTVQEIVSTTVVPQSQRLIAVVDATV